MILGEVQVGAGMPCGRHGALRLGNDMVVVLGAGASILVAVIKATCL